MLQQLALPVGDLVGMNIKMLRQFRQGLVALEGSHRRLRLATLLLHFMALVGRFIKQGYHLSACPNFRGRL